MWPSNGCIKNCCNFFVQVKSFLFGSFLGNKMHKKYLFIFIVLLDQSSYHQMYKWICFILPWMSFVFLCLVFRGTVSIASPAEVFSVQEFSLIFILFYFLLHHSLYTLPWVKILGICAYPSKTIDSCLWRASLLPHAHGAAWLQPGMCLCKAYVGQPGLQDELKSRTSLSHTRCSPSLEISNKIWVVL